MSKKYSVCSLDCPDTCRLQVSLDKMARVSQVGGDLNHPITQGLICNKMRHLSDRVYHPDRLLYPMKRVGPKGTRQFERISWDEAIDTIYYKFTEKIRDYGSETILPYSYAGTMGVINYASMDRRFFYKLGASKLERTICSAAGLAGYKSVMGSNVGVDPEDSVNAKLLIIWGANIVSTNIHQWLFIKKARNNGAKIFAVDVCQNKTSKIVDDFFQIKPGTDGALALGVINYLITNNLYDKNFIEKYTIGFSDLKEYAREYSLERVSKITGLSIDKIVLLADSYGKYKESFIRIGNGFQHHLNGGQATRLVTYLPALTGAWRYIGCGALKSNTEAFPLDKECLEMPELDQLNTRTINMNQLGDALTNLNNPLITGLFVYNSNPAIVAPDQANVIRGLSREDLFTVVHDIFITDTAAYADIILPAPSSLEYEDLYRSYWHLYLQLAKPLIPLEGEALQNTEVFRKLAKRFSFHEKCFLDEDQDLIVQALGKMSSNMTGDEMYDILSDKGYLKIERTEEKLIYKNLSTKSGKIEFVNDKINNNDENHYPDYKRVDVIARYYDNRELSGVCSIKYPLNLVNTANHMFLNSSFANIDKLKKLENKALIEINSQDAAQRNIKSGDKVEIYNDRGSCRLEALVTDELLEGTCVSVGLWWMDAYENGHNLNQLVGQELSDLGNGACFFSTFVEIKGLSS